MGKAKATKGRSRILPMAKAGGQKSLLTKLSMPSRPSKPKAGGCGCGGQTH